jgi:hypothetical protein
MFVLSIKENRNRRDTPGTRNMSIFLRSFPSATESKWGSAALTTFPCVVSLSRDYRPCTPPSPRDLPFHMPHGIFMRRSMFRLVLLDGFLLHGAHDPLLCHNISWRRDRDSGDVK